MEQALYTPTSLDTILLWCKFYTFRETLKVVTRLTCLNTLHRLAGFNNVHFFFEMYENFGFDESGSGNFGTRPEIKSSKFT
jgi:hypothetical protein